MSLNSIVILIALLVVAVSSAPSSSNSKWNSHKGNHGLKFKSEAEEAHA